MEFARVGRMWVKTSSELRSPQQLTSTFQRRTLSAYNNIHVFGVQSSQETDKVRPSLTMEELREVLSFKRISVDGTQLACVIFIHPMSL